MRREVGRFFLAVEQPRRAQRWFERAVISGDDRSMILLGDAMLVGGPTSIMVVEHLGLALTYGGDAPRAEATYRRALEAEGSPSAARRGLATSLLRQDRVAEAIACVDGCTELADLEAQAMIRDLDRRNAKTRSALKAIVPTLHDQLRRHPQDTALRDRLARIHISLLEFDEALAVASSLPSPRPTATLAEWTRATSSGRHREAHEMKQRAARRLGNTRARRTGSLGELMVRAQAINYVSGPEAALEAIDRRWLWIPTATEQRAQKRLVADFSLLCGDLAPLRDLANSTALPETAATVRYRQMISGRRVLVVGPSPTHRPSADVVAAHDVVAITGHQPRELGPQDSIAYLNNEGFVHGTIRDGQIGEEQMIVLRPSIASHGVSPETLDANIRLQPFEDSTPLLGTHFAVQRIVHDVLAHGATEVTLAGIDFFLGDRTYIEGYHAGDADRFATVPFNAAHDFAYDFSYTKRLVELGIVDAVPGVLELLEQDLDEYLDSLGTVFL